MTQSQGSDATVHGLSRREVLQRGAFVAGAAALWATPIVQTVGMRPAAATGLTGDVCPPGGGHSQPRGLRVLFQPAPCSASSNDQPGGKGGLPNCGSETGTFPNPVPATGWTVHWQATGSGNPSDTFTPEPGQELTLGGPADQPGAWATFEIELRENGEVTYSQLVSFHTSCSQPLAVGDVFGSIVIGGFAQPGSS